MAAANDSPPAATGRLWVVYREGLRLIGCAVAVVPFESAISRLDLAVWRLFTTEAPEETPCAEVKAAQGRKRVLVEVRDHDLPELSGYPPGCYESPYSPDEALRRLGLPPL